MVESKLKLLQELSKIDSFKLYFLGSEKEKGEYPIPINVTRLNIFYRNSDNINQNRFYTEIKRHKIDIVIYQQYDTKSMQFLLNLGAKVTAFNHSSLFYWFYDNVLEIFIGCYFYYRKLSLVLSLIPIEGNYIMKKCGIYNVLTFSNFMTFNSEKINPSNLTSKKYNNFWKSG